MDWGIMGMEGGGACLPGAGAMFRLAMDIDDSSA